MVVVVLRFLHHQFVAVNCSESVFEEGVVIEAINPNANSLCGDFRFAL